MYRQSFDQENLNAALKADSPFALELSRGDIAMKFPLPLEKEFRLFFLERIRQRARAWLLAVALVALLTTIVRYAMGTNFGWNLETALRLGLLLPVTAWLAAVAWTRRFDEKYLATAAPLWIVFNLVTASLVALLVVDGRPEALTFLTTALFGSFVLAGLLFTDAVIAAALGILGYVTAAWLFGMSIGKLAFDSGLLLLTGVIAAYAAYQTEVSIRQIFLEHGVLGDLAERDSLTGLRNRRAFDDHLRRVWQQSLRDRTALAVLLIDIDQFKLYNDNYGHQEGDGCLQRVAALCRQFARRPLDVAARYGGEELAIVLYQVDAAQATQIADDLRQAVESARIVHEHSKVAPVVTVSIGVAWIPPGLRRSPENAIKIADDALYAAKLAGRNRVEIAGNGNHDPLREPRILA
ncbi:MAG: GGDEF domain-containing protein [Steroidobacteraceae bacterium]